MIPTMNEIELVVAEMFAISETDVSISQYIQYYPALIARVKTLEAAVEQSLEIELCHETSCPYPARAMCNDDSHKIRRKALEGDGE